MSVSGHHTPPDQTAAERHAAQEKLRQAREEGGPLLEAVVRGHGCCLINDPEFDQALWDAARDAALENAALRARAEQAEQALEKYPHHRADARAPAKVIRRVLMGQWAENDARLEALAALDALVADLAPFQPIPAWAVHGADHLTVRGLLAELPDIGEVFTVEQREVWLDAMRKLFQLLYDDAAGVPPTQEPYKERA